MVRLFISFSGVLKALRSGRVTAEDLEQGLFVFGRPRDHVFSPGSSGEYVEDVVRERPELHELLLEALIRAEADGRVRWRSRESNTTFELVDELLTANGYKPLARGGRHYYYQAVEERSTELEVIWHD